VNFTREPIIETIITPREGCKLVVRSSKGGSQEDYFVDAVEVVSFGHSFFFRSQERPKSFLVPVSDYEILELKETRMVLKNASAERSIKIGGGREAPVRHSAPREAEEPTAMAEEEESPVQPQQEAPQGGDRSQLDKKRSRRSRRRRGGSMEGRHEQPAAAPAEQLAESEESGEETEEAAPSFISKLFPPPPKLIKETLRYKTSEEGIVVETDREASQEGIYEHPLSEASEEPPTLPNEDQPPKQEGEESDEQT